MNSIDTSRLLVRLGATKSKLRSWVHSGLILRTNGNDHNLRLDDTFSEDSLSIRTAFLLAGDRNNQKLLNEVLDAELGKGDNKLPGLLTNNNPKSIIIDIAKRHQLHYDLRKIGLFSNNN